MKDVRETLLSELDYRPEIRGRKDYNIGVIGSGRIALRRLIPAYRHAGLNVVAVADIRQEALQEAAGQLGIERGYLDYRQLLEQNDVDIVDICTNTFPRKQITLDAIAAGKHVNSEKPFARSYEDALEMVEAAERAGVHMTVHQPTRWHYPCAIARELVLKGLLGDVFYIELRMHGNQDEVYYEDPVTRWHADLRDHIFVEWGAHHFDLCRWFSGGETPNAVFAYGTARGNENFKSEMAVAASCQYKSGILAGLSLNQASRFPGLCNTRVGMSLRIEGSEGVAAGDMVYDLAFESRVRGGIKAAFDFSESLPEKEDPYNYLWCPSIRDGHIWPMAELINEINSGHEALCGGRDNLETVATYLAAMKSFKEHRPVSPREIAEGKRQAQEAEPTGQVQEERDSL